MLPCDFTQFNGGLDSFIEFRFEICFLLFSISFQFFDFCRCRIEFCRHSIKVFFGRICLFNHRIICDFYFGRYFILDAIVHFDFCGHCFYLLNRLITIHIQTSITCPTSWNNRKMVVTNVPLNSIVMFPFRGHTRCFFQFRFIPKGQFPVISIQRVNHNISTDVVSVLPSVTDDSADRFCLTIIGRRHQPMMTQCNRFPTDACKGIHIECFFRWSVFSSDTSVHISVFKDSCATNNRCIPDKTFVCFYCLYCIIVISLHFFTPFPRRE